ncbi:MAG TPA: hypothetical protein VGX94_03365 [Terriglobia bacterium]|nr:hypothetical protein [Terriglobia bacterium]
MAIPSLVILSPSASLRVNSAKNPGISAQGKLREPGEGYCHKAALR